MVGRAMLRAMRWRIEGDVPHEPKFVVIFAPHTSNWDFAVGIAGMFALDLKVHWFGKHTLFRWPLGPLLRLLGGRPVRRDLSEGVVAEAARVLRAERQFILALAPEGTRRRVPQWRTGFYRIAEAAQTPIVPVRLDWSRREVFIGAPMLPSGDMSRDIAALQSNYRAEMARHPAQFWGESSST
jgi:1-acyl-sn-glycerol-3-phosphate acyltransferase